MLASRGRHASIRPRLHALEETEGEHAAGVNTGFLHSAWNERLARPTANPSIAVDTGAAGSVAAPRVTNSGVKCSTVR